MGFITVFTLLLFSISPIFGQFKNCRFEWQKYYKCLNTVNENFNIIHSITDGQWNQVETDMQQCFRSEGCGDPYVNGAVRNGRKACFNQQRNRMRNDVRACVRRYIPQSDLHDEALDNQLYNRYINWVNTRARDTQVCPPSANKGRINTCIRDRIKVRTGKSRTTGAQCPIKQSQCDGPSVITDQCYDDLQRRYKPVLCRCLTDLRTSGRLSSYKDQYRTCFYNRNRNSYFQVQANDPNVQYFDQLQTTYCNVREICAHKRQNIFG